MYDAGLFLTDDTHEKYSVQESGNPVVLWRNGEHYYAIQNR